MELFQYLSKYKTRVVSASDVQLFQSSGYLVSTSLQAPGTRHDLCLIRELGVLMMSFIIDI